MNRLFNFLIGFSSPSLLSIIVPDYPPNLSSPIDTLVFYAVSTISGLLLTVLPPVINRLFSRFFKNNKKK